MKSQLNLKLIGNDNNKKRQIEKDIFKEIIQDNIKIRIKNKHAIKRTKLSISKFIQNHRKNRNRTGELNEDLKITPKEQKVAHKYRYDVKSRYLETNADKFNSTFMSTLIFHIDQLEALNSMDVDKQRYSVLQNKSVDLDLNQSLKSIRLDLKT